MPAHYSDCDSASSAAEGPAARASASRFSASTRRPRGTFTSKPRFGYCAAAFIMEGIPLASKTPRIMSASISDETDPPGKVTMSSACVFRVSSSPESCAMPQAYRRILVGAAIMSHYREGTDEQQDQNASSVAWFVTGAL